MYDSQQDKNYTRIQQEMYATFLGNVVIRESRHLECGEINCFINSFLWPEVKEFFTEEFLAEIKQDLVGAFLAFSDECKSLKFE